jgi:tetratricopeptide (TPR) repeat protein
MMMEMARICARMRKASRGTPSQRKVSPARWLVPALAAVLALAPVCSAPAQTDADLMEGRGRGVSFPISCGEDIQPRFDAALAALHSFWGTPEDRIHALDYLVYAHLQLAQDRKAKEVLELALKIENDLIARKHDSGLRARPFGVAAMEARWALERLDWTTAASLPLRPGRYPYAEAVPHFARAVGLARSGRPEQAGAEIERLAALQKGLADAKILYWARQVDIERKVASAWVDRALGRDGEAVALMQEAATEEETSESHDTLSPGPVGMTAHEALGLLLLELGRPGEALPAFETSLRTAKNRLRSYAGAAAAAAAAGNAEAARNYYTKLLELTDGSDGVRPELAQARAYLRSASK